MKIQIWNLDGETRRIQSSNLDGFIADGWLTSPPDLNAIAEEPEVIAPKKKSTKSAPVESE
jgi:hypothetical protein